MTEENIFYKAFASRDARFDGIFYIGVTSTGIYCRPICTARLPKETNCRFFKNAETAEKAGFRPCLKCRPELAPGHSPIDNTHRIASLIVNHLEEDGQDDDNSLEEIAKHFELSSRQIRRIIKKEFGVSPIELIVTKRLLLAKQLLTETSLPITEIAFASGFSSIRRFNDAFNKRYQFAPSHFRKDAPLGKDVKNDTFSLQITYRPPYDWNGILSFLKTRALKGVECIKDDRYLRTIRLGKYTGWISISHLPEKNSLILEVSHSLMPVLSSLLARMRYLFDLNARPDLIKELLQQDPLLAEVVQATPGLRVPGAFDGFELAVRAVLGQQITVKAATTLAGRFIEAFGEMIVTPYSDLSHLCPTPDQIASLKIDELASLGIIQNRAKAIIHLAEEMATKRLKLDAGVHPDLTIKQLIKIPGIGKWTAHYIAMRALRWPDAFPKEDVALLKSLGGITPKQAEELSQAWRPWRSYATLYLWKSLTTKTKNS